MIGEKRLRAATFYMEEGDLGRLREMKWVIKMGVSAMVREAVGEWLDMVEEREGAQRERGGGS